MIKVGIVGCSGYTAIEAIKLLLRHPQATIVAATSRQADGSSLVDMHPQFSSRTQLLVEDLTPKQVAERCDVAFCCLPHGASAPICSELLASGCRVIDLSADYRLSTPALYHKWYGDHHPDPGRLVRRLMDCPNYSAKPLRRPAGSQSGLLSDQRHLAIGSATARRHYRKRWDRHRFQERCQRRGPHTQAR